MRVWRTLLLCTAAVGALAGQAAAQPAAQPQWSTVAVPTGGFSIAVPVGWASATSAEPEAVARLNAALHLTGHDMSSLVAADASRPGLATMEVVVYRPDGRPTLSALARDLVDGFKKATSLSMTSTAETLPAGKAIALRATVKVGGEARLTVAYLLLRAGVVYLVSYITSHPADKALIAHSARSFTLLDAPDLSNIVLRPTQVGRGYKMKRYPLGDSFIGQQTLDLCAGTFPSDGLRTGRLQTSYVPPKGHAALSNEVVTYVPGGSQQALRELQGVLTSCSRHPVVHGKGANRVAYSAHRVTLSGLPADAIAISYTITVGAGKKPRSWHSVAVFQVSGNRLSGVYVFAPTGTETKEAVLLAAARKAALASHEQLVALALTA